MDDQTPDIYNPSSAPADGVDEQSGGFFMPMDDAPLPPSDSGPIVLGPPADADDMGMGFAAAPIPTESGYIGEVDDTAVPADDMYTPIEEVYSPPVEYSAPQGMDSFAAPQGMDSFAAPQGMDSFGSQGMDSFAAPQGMDAFAAPQGVDVFAAPPADAPILLGEPSAEALPEPEPIEVKISPLALWSEQWQITLRERKDTENACKGEQVERARGELENFQTERDIKKETKMSKNRSDEQSKLEAMEADLENDNSWQRVVKLVDLNLDAVDGGKDVKRMRDVLILMKNDTQRAAILV